MEKLLIQKIIKIFIAVVIFSVLAFFGYIVGGVVKYNIDIRKADKAVERFQGSLEQPYKEDTYGGKTPEETWAMYLDALKKGDIDLASRYYAVGDQKEAEEWHKKLIQENKLEEIIKESEILRKSKNQPLSVDEVYYSYDTFSEEFQQILTARVVFYLNPYTKIWKILW